MLALNTNRRILKSFKSKNVYVELDLDFGSLYIRRI